MIVCVGFALLRLMYSTIASLCRIMSNVPAPGWDWECLTASTGACGRGQKHVCVKGHPVDVGRSSMSAQSSTITVTHNVAGQSLRKNPGAEDRKEADAASACSEDSSDVTAKRPYKSAWKEASEEKLLELRASGKDFVFMKLPDGRWFVNENGPGWYGSMTAASLPL